MKRVKRKPRIAKVAHDEQARVFRLENGKHIIVTLEDNKLNIRNRDMGGLVVKPVVSNSIEVWVGE